LYHLNGIVKDLQKLIPVRAVQRTFHRIFVAYNIQQPLHKTHAKNQSSKKKQ